YFVEGFLRPEKRGEMCENQPRRGKHGHRQGGKPQPPFAPSQLLQVDDGGLFVITRRSFQGRGLGREAYPISERSCFCSVKPAKHIPQFRPQLQGEAIPKRYRPLFSGTCTKVLRIVRARSCAQVAKHATRRSRLRGPLRGAIPSFLWKSTRFAGTSRVCVTRSRIHNVNAAPCTWISQFGKGAANTPARK